MTTPRRDHVQPTNEPTAKTGDSLTSGTTTAAEHDPMLPLFDHSKVRGWPKNADAPTVPYRPASELLSTLYPVDAHFAAYSLPEQPHRLTNDVLNGACCIEMALLVFDVDCKEVHGTKTPPPPEWLEQLEANLKSLEQAHPGAFVHMTRGGARIVYRLERPHQLRDGSDKAQWADYYRGCCDYIETAFGIEADRACSDWTRLFRLPGASRDGLPPVERETHGNCSAIGLWSFSPTPSPMSPPKLKRVKRNTRATLEPVTPQACGVLFHLLHALGDVGHNIDAGKWAVRCPFEHEHTMGTIFDTSTVLFVPDTPTEFGHLHCSHNACDGRSQDQYLAMFSPEEVEQALRSAAEKAGVGVIKLGTDEHRIADEAVRALCNVPELFQRGLSLVRLHQVRTVGALGTDQSPVSILGADRAYLRDVLTSQVTFVQEKQTTEGVTIVKHHPPAYLADAIASRHNWPGMRVLNGVVQTPVLRPDGSVFDRPGYDHATGLVYVPNAEFIPVQARPSRDEALAASELLLDIVSDFPFADSTHRAAWVAGLLTPLARHAFTGPSPLLVIDGNGAGVGKGLLANVLAKIAIGRLVPVMAQVESEAEERKRITAIAMAGDPLVIIDNVVGPFASHSLEALLTTTQWSDRILGSNAKYEGQVSAFWMLTGNNVEFARRDMYRRVLYTRLVSPDERPEHRAGFKYADLLAHVEAARAHLTTAAVTILAAYCAAGRPQVVASSLGSFEGWSAVVRSAVVWAGLDDPIVSATSFSSVGDAETMGLRNLLHAWRDATVVMAREGMSANEALKVASGTTGVAVSAEGENLRQAINGLAINASGQLPNANTLGAFLRSCRERTVDGLMFKTKKIGGTNIWSAVQRKRPADTNRLLGDLGDLGDLSKDRLEPESIVGVTKQIQERSQADARQHVPQVPDVPTEPEQAFAPRKIHVLRVPSSSGPRMSEYGAK